MCYLMGDFNLNLINTNKHSGINNFYNCFMSYMYVPLINSPTRVSPYSATLIDNIFTNAIDLVESNNYSNGI